jgi:hypothetical protein
MHSLPKSTQSQRSNLRFAREFSYQFNSSLTSACSETHSWNKTNKQCGPRKKGRVLLIQPPLWRVGTRQVADCFS